MDKFTKVKEDSDEYTDEDHTPQPHVLWLMAHGWKHHLDDLPVTVVESRGLEHQQLQTGGLTPIHAERLRFAPVGIP